MPLIEITSLPPGDAPSEVRAAWIGLRLKIATGNLEPQVYYVSGIHTRFDGWLWRLALRLRIYRPFLEKMVGYAIELMPAVWVLEQAGQVSAAMWWCENTPHLVKPGQMVIFPSSCCRVFAKENTDV